MEQTLSILLHSLLFVKSHIQGIEYPDVRAESGQQFAESVKDGLEFRQKKEWYKGLRGTDLLLQNQQLIDFEQFVCQAPCRRQKEFQWGLCERLAQLASAHPDLDTRKSTLSFLQDLYRNDLEWGQHICVKQ